MGSPAIIEENRRVQGAKMTYGHRSLTFLRPICSICQDGKNVPRNWAASCKHDPYITVVNESWDQPEYKDETKDGKLTGNKILVGSVTKTRPFSRPNWVEISVTPRINGGVGAQVARAKGFIRPSELKNDLYPDGIAECCEWSDCKWQSGLKDYKEGRFCNEEEARLAAWDARRVPGEKKVLEVGWNAESQEKRREQLDSVVLQ